jgi:uncharacterized membrane protein YdjX (TVP38/TMEM64 family)
MGPSVTGELHVERIPASEPRPKSVRARLLRPLLVAIVVAAAVYLYRHVDVGHLLHPERIRNLVAPYGAWGPLIYSVFKIISMLLIVPLMPVSVAAGLLFGFGWGTVINIVTNILGSALAFAIARRLGGDTIRARLTGRWAAFDRSFNDNGFAYLMFMRLTPVFPWNPLSYALAVTRISWRDFLLATAIGGLPTTLVYSYVGAAAGEASLGKLGIALTGLALLSLIPTLNKRRKAAQKAAGGDTDLTPPRPPLH